MPLDSSLYTGDDVKGEHKYESFSWDNHADIIRKIGPDQKFITFLNDEGKEIKISLLDLDNIGNFSDDEISEMLKSILGVTIQSPEGLSMVNELAQRAFEYLKKELLYTDAELRGVGNIHFTSSKDIIKFFSGTKKAHGLQKCMLAKVGMLFNDGVGYSVEEKRKKTSDVMENKVVKNLEDLAKKSSLGFDERDEVMDEFKENGKSSFAGSFFVENEALGSSRKINFTVEFREKTIESTISKSLREKDYVNQGDIMDLLGIRIITKTKEEKILLMNHISQLAFKYGEYRIKNKNGISKSDLENILGSSDFFTQNTNTAGFIKKLEESFSKVETRANTALKYSDIKLVPVGSDNKLSFEIMFLDEGHGNDAGLAHHTPFSYFRKLAERIRLEGYVTSEAISRVANSLIEKISKSSKADLGNIGPTELMKEMLIDISGEIPESGASLKLKTRHEIQEMKKIELEFELRRVLPLYYQTKLFVFKDSKGNTSRRKKFTNKVGLENLSVLSEA